jgi:hypothetical protein
MEQEEIRNHQSAGWVHCPGARRFLYISPKQACVRRAEEKAIAIYIFQCSAEGGEPPENYTTLVDVLQGVCRKITFIIWGIFTRLLCPRHVSFGEDRPRVIETRLDRVVWRAD